MNGQLFQPLGLGAGTLLGGRYDVMEKLGAGAMSAVYKVYDRAVNNDVIALKLFSPLLVKDEASVQRFKNEVSILRKLTHPNIIRVFDFGQLENGYYFMTMEYVKGRTLEGLLKEVFPHKLPLHSSMEIICAIAHGISYAHAMGVVHRDLKPANVLIADSGEIKIADFGLATATDSDMKLTQTGECVGTPFYMSPEQVQGLEVDSRADIYALGIIAFELVVGHVPFTEESWFNLANQIVKTPTPRFANKKNGIPEWYETFVLKATDKSKEQRYGNADEISKLVADHFTEEEKNRSVVTTATQFKPMVLSGTQREIDSLEAQMIRFAPYVLIFCLGLMGVIVLAHVGEKTADKVNETIKESNFEEAFQAMDRVSASLGTIQKLAVDYANNKEAIDTFIAEANKQKEKEQQQQATPEEGKN